MNAKLVKWDAAALEAQMPAWKRLARRVALRFGRDLYPPAPSAADLANPAAHPACLEVIELAEGREPQTLYRRS